GRRQRDAAADGDIDARLPQLLDENGGFLIRQGQENALRLERLDLADKRPEVARAGLHAFQQQHLAARLLDGLGGGLAGVYAPVILRIRNDHFVGLELFLDGVGVVLRQDVVGVVLAEDVVALLGEVRVRGGGADLRNLRFGEY